MQATLTPTMQPQPVVSLRYPVQPDLEAWVLPEGKVPESTTHFMTVHRICELLLAWIERCRGERSLRVAADLAVRWLQEHPRTGADPDVCVIEPAPADFDDLVSLKLWEPGRLPPRLAIEVVSTNFPHKDYGRIQERYAALGVEELVVFDPLLSGPRSLGGPVPLQLWRRDATRAFERVQFGADPVYSNVLEAWVIARGRDLDIADDRQGKHRWLTAQERLEAQQAEIGRAQANAERAQANAERAQADAERAQADAARAQADAERAQADAERERQARLDLEARMRELEAKLSR